MSKSIQSLIFLISLFATQVHAATTLQLDPIDGAVNGQPGQTVGWGFTLSNNTNFLIVTSASFDSSISLGIFSDYISQPSNFFVVGPSPESSSISQVYNPANQTGVGSFVIDSNAVIGTIANGQIVLTYDLFSVSPNDQSFNPDTDTISSGNILTADASVRVSDNAVPIPSAIWLLGSSLLGLYGFRRR